MLRRASTRASFRWIFLSLLFLGFLLVPAKVADATAVYSAFGGAGAITLPQAYQASTNGLPDPGPQSFTFQPQAASQTVTLVAIADGYVWSNGGGNGSHTAMLVGFDEQFGRYRSFVRFDLSQIPSDATIDSAVLELVTWGGGTSEEVSVSVFRTVDPWEESTLSFGVGHNTSVSATTSVSGDAVRKYGWSVTGIVENWINGTHPNYGFALRFSDDSVNQTKFINFRTKEYVFSFDHPRLIVTYTPKPQPITVEVNTNPTGLQVTVEDTQFTAPYTETWDAGSSFSLDVVSPQNIPNVSSRHVFTHWSDGGSKRKTVSPTSPTTYTANFKIQHFVATRDAPGGCGACVGGGGWYDQNSTAFIGPAPNKNGYVFSHWRRDGIQTIGTNPDVVPVIVNAPMLVEAVYVPSEVQLSSISININPKVPSPVTAGGVVTGSGTITGYAISGRWGQC